jgi:hypothetical protein
MNILRFIAVLAVTLVGLASKPSVAQQLRQPDATAAEACQHRSGETVASVNVYRIGDLRDIGRNALNGRVAANELQGSGPLWGIGMPSGLDAEVLVLDSNAHIGRFDGLTYRSSVEQLPAVAFFVYARVSAWCAVAVPDSVQTFAELEAFVPQAAAEAGLASNRPFPFRIEADIASLRWFVVGGDGDGRPDHRASFLRERRLGPLSNRTISALGFYVPGERGILTNPVSNIHIHFTTRDQPRFVGHLDDEIYLQPGGTLLLPAP